ncbi:hypothetical protein B5K05_13505 [Rhizobium phaseoli]|nr:hypothetical protein B5K04_13480 [Rhizobium phaseoli]RDJ14140.1 hypothetical protein B5K05_13505 [Rhizobium phaseoli]
MRKHLKEINDHPIWTPLGYDGFVKIPIEKSMNKGRLGARIWLDATLSSIMAVAIPITGPLPSQFLNWRRPAADG